MAKPSTNNGGDVVRHIPQGTSGKHPKSGPRKWDSATYKDFDFNYGQIDWSKKAKNPVEVDPNAPICPLCKGKAPAGTCAGCN